MIDNKLVLCARNIELSQKLQNQRQDNYEQGIEIETGELSLDSYLRRLSKAERNNLVYLFSDVFYLLKRGTMLFMVLAVGTTTFPTDYWSGLKEYLKEHDPSKLEFVKRGGEDIDLLICSEDLFDPDPESWLKYAIKDLERQGIDYRYNANQRENGTSYWTVPEEHILAYEQKVVRVKSEEYDQSISIKPPDSREFHIFFEHILRGEIKLKYERIQKFSFSLLFRHGRYMDLEKQIKIINNQREFDF